MKASLFNINLIVAYVPTSNGDKRMIKEFYDSLDKLYSNSKSQEVNNMMGDFNAKVGCEKHGEIVGPHGLGTRGEREDRLMNWCEEEKLAIMNTCFAAHARRRYTWTSPGDRARNQIDYTMINEKY